MITPGKAPEGHRQETHWLTPSGALPRTAVGSAAGSGVIRTARVRAFPAAIYRCLSEAYWRQMSSMTSRHRHCSL